MNDVQKNMQLHVDDQVDEKGKMLAGRLFYAKDLALRAERAHARELLQTYNNLAPDEPGLRRTTMTRLFGGIGEKINIEPPFHCDYGYNINIGENFSANFDCVMLDSAKIVIGNNVFLGPGVHIYTAMYPLEVETRNGGHEWAQPVVIGDNVWIGGRAIIMPGVSIGDGATIGAGSVVTDNIPANVMAVGNPCRPVRVLKSGVAISPGGAS